MLCNAHLLHFKFLRFQNIRKNNFGYSVIKRQNPKRLKFTHYPLTRLIFIYLLVYAFHYLYASLFQCKLLKSNSTLLSCSLSLRQQLNRPINIFLKFQFVFIINTLRERKKTILVVYTSLYGNRCFHIKKHSSFIDRAASAAES